MQTEDVENVNEVSNPLVPGRVLNKAEVQTATQFTDTMKEKMINFFDNDPPQDISEEEMNKMGQIIADLRVTTGQDAYLNGLMSITAGFNTLLDIAKKKTLAHKADAQLKLAKTAKLNATPDEVSAANIALETARTAREAAIDAFNEAKAKAPFGATVPELGLDEAEEAEAPVVSDAAAAADVADADVVDAAAAADVAAAEAAAAEAAAVGKAKVEPGEKEQEKDMGGGGRYKSRRRRKKHNSRKTHKKKHRKTHKKKHRKTRKTHKKKHRKNYKTRKM
jgi:hypothetical protein